MPGIIIDPDVGQATYHFNITTEYVDAPVPEPATIILLSAGLLGLAGFGRRRFKKN
jgi:hypothetical protein